jgi:regulator of protease activity HflC (stomatin/prohibitin superfamily)
MERVNDDPILAFIVPLLMCALAGALLWMSGTALALPWLVFAASVLFLWVLLSLGLCALLALWLRRWLLGAILTAAWFGWYVAGLLSATDREVIFLLSVVPAGLLLVGGLWFVAGYVLPPSPHSTRRKAFRTLLTYILGTNYRYYQLEDVPEEDRRLAKRAEARVKLPPSGPLPIMGPGLVSTGSDHAVVISDGLRFKGVQGPGLVLTGAWDRPVQTIDLRQQLRVFTVEALTKDGIGVEVKVFVPFQIDRGESSLELGKPIPYRKQAVFKAHLAQRLEHSPDAVTECRWDDLPAIVGRRALQRILATFTFDELYQPYEIPGQQQSPRSEIVNLLRQEMDEALMEVGIQILGVGIDNLLPQDADTVLRQRIESWQARWARDITLIEADGQSERMRMVEEARAEAQSSLILALGRRLEELSVIDQAIPAKEIATWFLETLQEMTRQPLVQQLLSQEATAMMDYVKSRIESTDE